MKLDVIIRRGVVESLGSRSATPARILYDSISMSDGQRVSWVGVSDAMDHKLNAAVKAGKEVELHVVKAPGAEHAGLVAMREAGGQLFAESVAIPAGFKIAPLLIGLFGVVTIPFFGVGLILIFIAWRLSKKLAPLKAIASYAEKLPGAVKV